MYYIIYEIHYSPKLRLPGLEPCLLWRVCLLRLARRRDFLRHVPCPWLLAWRLSASRKFVVVAYQISRLTSACTHLLALSQCHMWSLLVGCLHRHVVEGDQGPVVPEGGAAAVLRGPEQRAFEHSTRCKRCIPRKGNNDQDQASERFIKR